MARPRVIIADTDAGYIVPLQLKFVTEFFDKIDLEIITDPAYFEELFSRPQKVEILVVSEDLYDTAIQKHNIGNIFLMKERQEEEQTQELNLTSIFKYSSIKEIFNEILGKSGRTLNIDNTSKQEPQIIVVTSAAGGAGKTTVAMGISACLTKNYKRVLYINAEHLQTFQHMLTNTSVIPGNEIYSKLMDPNNNLYREMRHLIRSEVFSYIPPFKASLMSLGLKSDIYEKIARAAKQSRDYDFVIVDTDSVFNEEKAGLLAAADKVIFVTRQNKMSVLATNVLVSNINGLNQDKYMFVCNDFRGDEENALILPEITVSFSVNEYIEHIPDYDRIKGSDMSAFGSIQKMTYLFL